MKHSDVPTALELVVEEVGKESQRIRDAGGEALKAGKLKPAKKAISFAEKLGAFVKKVRALGEEWERLQTEIDGAAPEVKEIVRPPLTQKEHKTGWKRNVVNVSPKTNFTVSFPDGTVVSDKKAYVVLGKSIEKFGPSAVAALGISCGGEPLVTQDRSVYKKQPSAVDAISGDWFVKTHSSTKAKIGYVKRIAKALKIKVTVKCA
jgi:hypothetical protein